MSLQLRPRVKYQRWLGWRSHCVVLLCNQLWLEERVEREYIACFRAILLKLEAPLSN